MALAILNFSHALTPTHVGRVEKLARQNVERVIEAQAQFDAESTQPARGRRGASGGTPRADGLLSERPPVASGARKQPATLRGGGDSESKQNPGGGPEGAWPSPGPSVLLV